MSWTCKKCGNIEFTDFPSAATGGKYFCPKCWSEVKVMFETQAPLEPEVKRVKVNYRFDALNLTFLKWMAKIGAYADEKYGAWEQYSTARLTGEKSPMNHIMEHYRSFVLRERYDHFDGDVRWHLVAIAYNAMMEFYYTSKWGHIRHPLHVEEPEPADKPDPRATVET